eukprot:489633-Pleurochrysis_carterae.AAC.1
MPSCCIPAAGSADPELLLGALSLAMYETSRSGAQEPRQGNWPLPRQGNALRRPIPRTRTHAASSQWPRRDRRCCRLRRPGDDSNTRGPGDDDDSNFDNGDGDMDSDNAVNDIILGMSFWREIVQILKIMPPPSHPAVLLH